MQMSPKSHKQAFLFSLAFLMAVVALREGGVLEGPGLVRWAADLVVAPASLATIALAFFGAGVAGRG